MTSPLLSVEDLTVSIHETPILSSVGFDMEAGSVLGVIGESGSGKSMTAYAVMGLLPTGARVSGRVDLAGRDLLGLSEKDMCSVRGAEIGMVFQEPMTALNPVQTIGDQVAETALVHGQVSRKEARALARATLARVGLPADRFPLDRFPHELSGGQRQRVVIAMAIALRPKLLIADEPTTALDVTTQAQILKLLKRLVDADGMGLMLISHDLGVVADLADSLAIMRRGEIVEAGPTGTVLTERRHAYTRALLAASTHQPDRHQPPQKTIPVLEVRDLVRDYALPRTSLFAKPGRFRAVDQVSFKIDRGETLGLVGESGCGKSTLSRAVLGLDSVQGGRVAVAGETVSSENGVPRDVRRRMQAVFQDPYGSFNPRHRVARLVAEPFHLLDRPLSAAEARGRVEKALEQVGLRAEDADKYIHEFSGGQRQRIAIARAIVIEPDLVVLDEAVSALDVSVRARILDLLADLSGRLNLSYLFISHDLSVVRAITDRVLVMKAGRIVEEGDTDEVFQAPMHPYTRELIAASPDLEAALSRRAG